MLLVLGRAGTGLLWFTLSYDDRVKRLGLMRLNTRRLRNDLVETFKIINGKYSIDSEKFFEFDDGNRRGHSKLLK